MHLSPSKRRQERVRQAVRDELDAIFCVGCGHSKLWHRRKGPKKWSNDPKSRGASIVESGCEHHIRWGRKQEPGTCICLKFFDPEEYERCGVCQNGRIPRWRGDKWGEICTNCNSMLIVKRSVKSG